MKAEPLQFVDVGMTPTIYCGHQSESVIQMWGVHSPEEVCLPSEDLKIISVQMQLAMIAHFDMLPTRLHAVDPKKAASRSGAIGRCVEAIILTEEAAISTEFCMRETKIT